MSAAAVSFVLNEEQQQLRDTVRAFLAAKSPEPEVRLAMETPAGYLPTVWRQMADQLALQSLAIPEEFGGSGFSLVEQGVVLEEFGRALLPGPYFASAVLAANVLLQSGDQDAKHRYLPGIAAGSTIATLAFTEESGRWDAEAIQTRAHPHGDSWTLDGTKMYVLDGSNAELLLVTAHTRVGISLFAVDDTDAVQRRTLSTLDLTRRQARVEFAGTPARLIGREGACWPSLVRALDMATAGLAAEQVGGAQRCLEMAVAYAKVRRQFGRPIGSFQAIRHKCADVMLDVECARGAAHYAMCAAAEVADDLSAAASLAKAACSEAYARAAAVNIQVHGGIGFTWEHPAHLYFRRAKSSGHLLGDATYHRELLADRIGL